MSKIIQIIVGVVLGILLPVLSAYLLGLLPYDAFEFLPKGAISFIIIGMLIFLPSILVSIYFWNIKKYIIFGIIVATIRVIYWGLKNIFTDTYGSGIPDIGQLQ